MTTPKTEKRSALTILLDREIGGMPQNDGTGRYPIFLDTQRLTAFARFAGGVEDEGMLDLLKTPEGFHRLVYSVGVSVRGADPDMPVSVSLKLLGAGGAVRRELKLRCNGEEQIAVWAQLAPQGQEAVLSEVLFTLPTDHDVARASMTLYLNEGFAAPPQREDPPVDRDTPRYREMIARSLLSSGNNRRLKRFLRRARAGEAVTAAFIGGSITQGAGAVPIQDCCYARKTVDGLRERYGSSIRFIKAGVGGTPSETGLLRYDRDVTRDGGVQPDLVVIEFAVNDEDDESEGVFYEGLVRRAWNAPNQPAVILLFSVFADDWNLKGRLAPIGYRYQLPMVNVLDAVSPQFAPEVGAGRVLSKRQYFADVFHPTNLGHRIMADCLLYLIDRLDIQQEDPPAPGAVPPCCGADYENLRLLDRSCGGTDAVIVPGSFTGTDTVLQEVAQDDAEWNTPMFPFNWSKGPGAEPFVLELTCSKLVLAFKDSDQESFGKAAVTVDGGDTRILDSRRAGWVHCHTTVLFNKRESRRHRVEIAMAPGEEDKLFTILGFGYVSAQEETGK